jgi:hypothetical protein
MSAADQQSFIPATNEAAMREYEARCCCVCQHRHPSFGFGPPLTRGGTVWACTAHRAAAEALIQRGQLLPL